VSSVEMTFGRYLRDTWLPFVYQRSSGTRSPRTPASYEKVVRRRVEPYILANVSLAALNPRAFDTWLGSLRVESNLCERTLLLTCHIMRAACRLAIRWELLERDPTTGMADWPRPRRRQTYRLSAPEVRAFLVEFSDMPLGPALALVVGAGLRPAEICGLRWADLSFETGTVWPKRNVVPRSSEMGGGLQVCQTKTESSATAVHVMPSVLSMLEAYHSTRLDRRPGAWMFPARRKVGPLRSTNLGDAFRTVRERLGLPMVRLYDLRHARAGLMLKAGADLFTVCSEMRHADIRTTSMTYLEPDEELGRNGVVGLDRIVAFQPPFVEVASAPCAAAPGNPVRVRSARPSNPTLNDTK
jgi:integrase